MLPKVKFLTVVWGVTYIERFAGLALPSFLAPGNLPALAAATDLEVIIMTARADIEHFDKHATFRRLRAICEVHFVEIDDLITSGVYGVTLTLAYARPIIASGDDMLKTHFVFMNADFVLADGSLRSLAKHILDSRSIVLGPSFRSIAEAVEPALLAAVNEIDGTLSVPPRKLVELSLSHPHPTTLAKTVNLGFSHSIHPNQFFWQVDEHTVLGRYYLIFMLCLKPERVIERIDSYCDYGFIPEMCPSGDTAVMTNSDDFFMLELQQRDQEMPLLYLGRASNAEIARSLHEWTTIEHRRNAHYDIVFHSQDIPPNLETIRREASIFISRIERMLGAAVPHSNHPYWTGGVETWRNRRLAQGLTAVVAEFGDAGHVTLVDPASNAAQVATIPAAKTGLPRKRRTSTAIKSMLTVGRSLILGQRPRVTIFHPDWLDCRLLLKALGSIQRAPAARALIVREVSDLPDSRFGLEKSARFVQPVDLLADTSSASSSLGGQYTHVLISLLRKDCRIARSLVEKCRPMMAPNCECHVFILHHQGEYEVSDFSSELVRYFDDILAWPLRNASFFFAGGVLKRFNRHLFNIYGAKYFRSGARALPFLVPALAVTLPFVGLSNAYLSRKQRDGAFVQYCSSMLIRIVI